VTWIDIPRLVGIPSSKQATHFPPVTGGFKSLSARRTKPKGRTLIRREGCGQKPGLSYHKGGTGANKHSRLWKKSQVPISTPGSEKKSQQTAYQTRPRSDAATCHSFSKKCRGPAYSFLQETQRGLWAPGEGTYRDDETGRRRYDRHRGASSSAFLHVRVEHPIISTSRYKAGFLSIVFKNIMSSKIFWNYKWNNI
jgi:hypothetical protein